MNIKLNDHYFISWLKIVKKYEVNIVDDKITVNMTQNEYSEALEEYKGECKPLLKEIRKFVKELASLTSKRENVK